VFFCVLFGKIICGGEVIHLRRVVCVLFIHEA